MTAHDVLTPALFRISARNQECVDTFTLELVPENGERYSFEPGQFNMLYVFGAGEVPISVSGDPRGETLVHTVRSVGTVTRSMTRLEEGEFLGVRGPFGRPWPVQQCVGRDVVIVAGGIGLAPLRPAILQILAEREKYGRVVLLYGARTEHDILYRHDLELWRSRFDTDVEVTVDRSSRGWRGNVGVVTSLLPRAPFDPSDSIAMVCGPEIMMKFTLLELERKGVPFENIYISMERNMKCATGFCGHCQFGSHFVCKDGPVFSFDQVDNYFTLREV